MRGFLKSFLVNSVGFYFVANFYPGIEYSRLESIVLAAVIFSLLTLFIKPLLKVLSLPFNLLTFGLFGFFISVIVIYLTSVIVGDFKIVGFESTEINIFGFFIPKLQLNPTLSAIIASTLAGWVTSFLKWLVK